MNFLNNAGVAIGQFIIDIINDPIYIKEIFIMYKKAIFDDPYYNADTRKDYKAGEKLHKGDACYIDKGDGLVYKCRE